MCNRTLAMLGEDQGGFLERDPRTTRHPQEVVLDVGRTIGGAGPSASAVCDYSRVVVDGGVARCASFKDDLESSRSCCGGGGNNQVGNAGFRRTRWERSVVTCLRLGSLLLALLTVTTAVNSAPVPPTAHARMMALQDKRWSSQPKWTNPCGYDVQDFESSTDFEQLSDETLLNNIATQAKTALNFALGYRDDYIKRTFNTDFVDLHLAWKGNRYDWLPSLEQIPKQLGESLDKEYLDKLELDTLLVDTYRFMQTYAAGLEQITWDQEDFGHGFHKQFQENEYMLRTVLCEIQVAQVERGVNPRADVGREAMPAQYRNMSDNASFRNLRDWLIFRDYMNALEYTIQVFEYLKREIES